MKPRFSKKLSNLLRRHWSLITLSLLILLIFLLHVNANIDIRLFRNMEYWAYDARLNLLMPQTVDRRIVIVNIDEKSLAAEGRWPWERDRIKVLIDNLFEHYKVKVAGFDIVFAERDRSVLLVRLQELAQTQNNTALAGAVDDVRPLLDRDRLLAESLQKYPVILGYYFNHDTDKTISSGALPAPTFLPAMFEGKNVRFQKASSYGGNLEVLQKAARGGGHFDNPVTDEDGVFRRVPMLQEYNGFLYESLSLAIARTYLGAQVRAIFATGLGVGKRYHGLEWLGVGDRRIPVDGEMATLVPYRGRQGSFPYVSAADIIQKTVSKPAALEGAIVLIGTTAPGLLDLRTTPVQKLYPGVEIHANLVSGILDQSFKQMPAYTQGAELLTVLLIGLVLSLVMPALSPIAATLTTLLSLSLVVGLNLAAWAFADLVLPLATSVLLILSLFVLKMSYGFLVEERGKRQLGRLFGQYIPPELVDEMSEDPKNYSLEGERREMTVLFSDVRGFTSISEGLDPKELSELMNEFLTPMTRVIHSHRGTIDKYMGDAIMAFWGAPIADPEHARLALDAALEMAQTLAAMQDEFAARGWPPIKIGVGLNSGVMNVGNMGSQFRMAYTVLGDEVNLGSRLEGLTKKYGVTVICSESTKRSVPEYAYRELDRVRVKGKDRPVKIFEPIGPTDQLDPATTDELRMLENALHYYRSQKWDQAELQFIHLRDRASECELYSLYLDRIGHFRQHSPGETWDGVFTHETK